MKRIFLVVMVVMFAAAIFGGPALAADVRLSWDAASGATSYKIQMSTDQGLTWPEERVVATGTTYTWIGAPDAGLLLFRAASVNAAGTVIRTDAGAWFNGKWKLPAQAGGLGTE